MSCAVLFLVSVLSVCWVCITSAYLLLGTCEGDGGLWGGEGVHLCVLPLHHGQAPRSLLEAGIGSRQARSQARERAVGRSSVQAIGASHVHITEVAEVTRTSEGQGLIHHQCVHASASGSAVCQPCPCCWWSGHRVLWRWLGSSRGVCLGGCIRHWSVHVWHEGGCVTEGGRRVSGAQVAVPVRGLPGWSWCEINCPCPISESNPRPWTTCPS